MTFLIDVVTNAKQLEDGGPMPEIIEAVRVHFDQKYGITCLTQNLADKTQTYATPMYPGEYKAYAATLAANADKPIHTFNNAIFIPLTPTNWPGLNDYDKILLDAVRHNTGHRPPHTAK